MKRLQFVKITLLTLTLMTVILFVCFNQSSSWVSRFKMLRKQEVDMERANYADMYAYNSSHQILTVSREYENYHISDLETVKISQVKDEGSSEVKNGCSFPNIDPFDPAVMAHSKVHPPISCKGGVPLLVYLKDDSIKVNYSKTASYKDRKNRFKECRYKSLGRKPGSDFETVVLYRSEPFNDSITLRDSDDNLVVECYNNNNTVLSRSYFSLIRVKKDLELLLEENFKKHMTLNAPKEVFNVLMIGIDGNSKQNFQRHMPKTRNFLLKGLNAIELHKHNKVGENTYPNIVPLLTGKPWTYFYQNNWTEKNHFDQVNDEFLWSDYNKAGYRTGLLLDDHHITAFHYLKKGWNKSPVDYYFRSSVINLKGDKLMKSRRAPHCVGDVPEITYNHDFWIQMALTFNNSQTKPFFGYSFSIHLTHDDHSKASAGDDLYLRFLQELRDKNVTNNTVIVFFSDHGARFGKIRQTYNGVIESRTPYVFLVFPPWFHQKYPDMIKVLKINQERLTTNTDVYETLRDLLNFQAESRLGDINKKGISLFQEIPRERTCEHAGISVEFCVCNGLTQTNVSSGMTMALAVAVQDTMNNLIQTVRDKCNKLYTDSVQSVMEVEPDNRAQRQAKEVLSHYQITLTTKPGGAVYEATVAIFNNTKKFKVMGGITRLNLYRGQADCIDDQKLKPYCFCKK